MTAPTPTDRYGPRSLVAALATIMIVETATWVWLPLWIANLFFFAIASAVVVPIGLFMSQLPDEIGQAGRGILAGYLATPLTIVIALIPAGLIYLLLD